MKIRTKTVLVYDVEIFKNIFHCSVKNTETKEIHKFEISIRKNQLNELIAFFKSPDIIFAGYNNNHFDNVIINYIIDYYKVMITKDYNEICISLYNLSQTIINSNDDDISAWKTWKYQHWFHSFDLMTMLYSKQLRVSLKEIQVTMQYPNVQEFKYNWHKPLEINLFDAMIDYNINDIESTAMLLENCKKDIDLRIEIEDNDGINCLSKDGVNIGMDIIAKKYLKKTGQKWWEIKDLRSPMDFIALKDVILPFITYKDPILKKMLNTLKEQTVSPGRNAYMYDFIYANLHFNVGVGGIHSIHTPEIIIPKDDEILIDIDVASLYPSILIEYEFYPKHLGKEFLEVYSQIRTERLHAKRTGDKVKNETLKFALNGLSGNLQNKHSFCYSPFAVMQIRINGQLLLLMLTEKLVEIGCRIVQANTDGLFVLLKKKDYDKAKTICKDWEKLTKLELEEDRFEAMYQYTGNDYIAIKEGYKLKTEKFKFDPEIATNKNGQVYKNINAIQKDYIKTKGIFNPNIIIGKGLSPKIIPEALINYFADNRPVKDTIQNCTDIRRFLQSEKTGKQWTVEYNDTAQQHTNRFYVSTNGLYLWKWKMVDKTKEYQAMLKGKAVTIHNVLTPNKPIEQYNIDYSYYISQVTKMINQFKPQQLSLWN